ncbi:E3 ubiquitin-protein ligase E3D-like isoform X1 [Clavelina lepadiformis]|uniref:E3 ubiquitin-protein ligase E3D-like isoform X1 n=1 Tax=Clavelina lepadiformis TaxID=159417 RepID=UPI0040435A44
MNKMEEEQDGSSYFMEVYDRIHSIDLVLRGSDHPKVIEVHPRKIVAKKCDGTEDQYPLVIEIEPTTCTAIQKHPHEGLGLRLQMRDTPVPQTSFMSTTMKRAGSELFRMERATCQCGCKTCGLTLFVNNVKFSRVLPLPSQTWRDLFNNWSCCSQPFTEDKVTPAYVTQSILKPREGDCFLDDFNILVHSRTVERKNILLRKYPNKAANKSPSPVQCVKCARCRVVVGEAIMHDDKKIDAYKLNKNNIEVLSLRKQMSETVVRPVFFSEFFLERLLAQQVSNAVQCHATHLFIIQDPESNIYLLLRVLNTGTRLFVNNGKSSNEVSDFSNEIFSKTIKTGVEEESGKHSKMTDRGGHAHSGNSDGSKKAKCEKTAMASKISHDKNTGIDTEKIRRDGPPRMHGSKVAEVIEKLFSFSTHLISIGRTCNEIRSADSTGCERIVKVMYANTFEEKTLNKLSLKWLRDERTLTLTYPTHICIQILLVLVSSTLTMPIANRNIDDFVVGFLRLD